MKYYIRFTDINKTVLGFESDDIIKSAVYDIQEMALIGGDYNIKTKFNDLYNSFRNTNRFILRRSYLSSTNANIYINKEDVDITLEDNDYLWIGAELFKVTEVTATEYKIIGGQNGTRKFLHTEKTEGAGILVEVNGRSSFAGLECYVFSYKGNLVFRGKVTAISSSGAGVAVDLQDLIQDLDKDIYIPKSISSSSNALIKHLAGWTQYNYYYSALNTYVITADWLILPFSIDVFFIKKEETLAGFNINVGEIINDKLKLDNKYFSFGWWNNGLDTHLNYNLKKLTAKNTFNSKEVSNPFSNLAFKGSYTSTSKIEYSSVLIKYNVKIGEEIIEKSIKLSAYDLVGKAEYGKTLQIATESVYIREEDEIDILTTVFELLLMLGSSYGYLEVDLATNSFEPGKYYPLDSRFRMFLSKEKVSEMELFCISVEEKRAQFLLVYTLSFCPISPAAVGIYDDTDAGYIFINVENEAYNKEYAMIYEDSGIATNLPGSDVDYFEEADKIRVMDSFNNFLETKEIKQINKTTTHTEICVDGAISGASNGDTLIFCYPLAYSGETNTKQNKFLYNNNGVV